MDRTQIERRSFFGALATLGSAVSAVAALSMASGCRTADGAVPPSSAPAADEWARVRDEFLLSPEWVHLAGFLMASHPKRVRDAIERHRRELDENPALYVEANAFNPEPILKPIPHFGAAAYGAWMRGADPPPTTADMMTPGGFHSFEHRWALGEAFEFHLSLGKAKVQARIHELNRKCKQGLAAMQHVTLHTPLADDTSSGIITFEANGLTPEQVVKKLHEKRIVASTTPYATSYARLAPGLINSPADIDRVLAEIRALA